MNVHASGLVLSLLLAGSISAQSLLVGVKLRLILGSHQVAYGLGVHAGFQHSLAMVNLGSDLTYYAKDFGHKSQVIETRSYLGLSVVSNRTWSNPDLELGTLTNYFQQAGSFGYAYIHYADNAGTSQFSGAFRGEYNGHSLFFENDFFAGQGKDRFRTASMRYRYRQAFWSAHVGFYLWTGEASGLPVKEGQWGGQTIRYKDLSNNPYGKTSHGVVYGGVGYNLLGQTIGFAVGYDSEMIRNGLQNRVAHNAVWHIKQRKNAVYYPMLDTNGEPTFDAKKIRPNSAYFRLSISGD